MEVGFSAMIVVGDVGNRNEVSNVELCRGGS